MSNSAIDEKILRVGDVQKGAVVILDGVIAKVVGFKNRNTLFLKNLSGGAMEWGEAKVGVRDVKLPKPMSFAVSEFDEIGMSEAELFALAMERGLRGQGIAAKCFVSGDKIDVKIMAERPEIYATLNFKRNEV